MLCLEKGAYLSPVTESSTEDHPEEAAVRALYQRVQLVETEPAWSPPETVNPETRVGRSAIDFKRMGH